MIDGLDKALSCVRCGKHPSQIPEYVEFGEEEGIPPGVYCWENEGTMNRETGKFACTDCYIAMGMPSSPGGWTP